MMQHAPLNAPSAPAAHGVLSPWSAAQAADFLQRSVLFSHAMGEGGLFEDEALARLLDAYPDDGIDINLYDYDASGMAALRTGARNGASGAELLAAVKAGRLWLNCKAIMDHSPAIGALTRVAFAEITAARTDFTPHKIWGQLLISSPAARVPYHADPSGVILFHLRGRKRIYVYPSDEAHAPQAELEKIVAQQQVEDLPYRPGMDAAAEIYDLEPGQAIAWPLYAPHRVENLSSFCVSLSIDYLTREQQILNGVHFTNLALRRLGYRPPPTQSTPPLVQKALWAASGGLKRLGVLREKLSGIPRDFAPSASAADGAAALPGAGVGQRVESR
jgi:hypothetical protein